MRKTNVSVSVKYVGVVGVVLTTASAVLGMGMMGNIRKQQHLHFRFHNELSH